MKYFSTKRLTMSGQQKIIDVTISIKIKMYNTIAPTSQNLLHIKS